VQKKSPLFEALTGEIDHRSIVGLLTILVLLLHLWMVVFLIRPTDSDNEVKPIKVMEVALLAEPSPKADAAPPAPSHPVPPKPVPPKKKAVKAPVKKKEPLVHKQGEIPKPRPVADEQTPTQPSSSESIKKSEPTVSGSEPTAKKPAEKTGNGDAQAKSGNSGVVPLARVEPKYPVRAASRHIEGWVKVEFTVSTTGKVTNAVVIGAEPDGIFDDAALEAIEKWKFKPRIVNGNAVAQRAVQVLKFKLVK
jgi:periplasmic protein TonB